MESVGHGAQSVGLRESATDRREPQTEKIVGEKLTI